MVDHVLAKGETPTQGVIRCRPPVVWFGHGLFAHPVTSLCVILVLLRVCVRLTYVVSCSVRTLVHPCAMPAVNTCSVGRKWKWHVAAIPRWWIGLVHRSTAPSIATLPPVRANRLANGSEPPGCLAESKWDGKRSETPSSATRQSAPAKGLVNGSYMMGCKGRSARILGSHCYHFESKVEGDWPVHNSRLVHYPGVHH